MLLLLDVLIIHLLLHLDIFLINSVDLLSQVLVLSLESFNLFVLLLDLSNLILVEIILDLDLVPQLKGL